MNAVHVSIIDRLELQRLFANLILCYKIIHNLSLTVLPFDKFLPARRYASAILVVIVCPLVRLSVCHISVFH